MMNKQTIFSKAYRHAQNMPWLARDENDTAAYRAPDGQTCLIGSFIPSDRYHEEMEGNVISELVMDRAEFRQVLVDIGLISEDFTEDEIDFAGDLQSCHDDAFNTQDMMSRLHQFAVRWALEIPGIW